MVFWVLLLLFFGVEGRVRSGEGKDAEMGSEDSGAGVAMSR